MESLFEQWIEAGLDLAAAVVAAGPVEPATFAALALVYGEAARSLTSGEARERAKAAGRAVCALAEAAEADVEDGSLDAGPVAVRRALEALTRIVEEVESDAVARDAEEREEDAACDEADSRRKAQEYGASRGVL